jgi:hypothetical protein
MEGELRVPASLQWRATDRDTVNLEANLGREHQVFALTSQRVLTQKDTATMTLTHSPMGPGLQFGCFRQLYSQVRGELNWILGPPGDAGVIVSVTRSADRWSATGKVQVLPRPRSRSCHKRSICYLCGPKCGRKRLTAQDAAAACGRKRCMHHMHPCVRACCCSWDTSQLCEG